MNEFRPSITNSIGFVFLAAVLPRKRCVWGQTEISYGRGWLLPPRLYQANLAAGPGALFRGQYRPAMRVKAQDDNTQGDRFAKEARDDDFLHPVIAVTGICHCERSAACPRSAADGAICL